MSPVRQEGYQFCQDLCIPCYQTDSRTVLTPAAFMDLAQEIAYWAAQRLGFGYDTLHVHHTAWVLSRMHIHLENPPRWRDEVKLYTWHKGANGLFYLRDFDLQDQAGNHLVKATSSWVVINEETRRLVRPEDLSSLLETMEKVDDAIAEPAPKLVLPRDAEPELAGQHTVAYSDIDIVGHTNNVRYIVWAMDCIPADEAAHPVKDVFINFNKETTLGEDVSLYRLKVGSSWFIEGRSGAKSCFVAQIDFC